MRNFETCNDKRNINDISLDKKLKSREVGPATSQDSAIVVVTDCLALVTAVLQTRGVDIDLNGMGVDMSKGNSLSTLLSGVVVLIIRLDQSASSRGIT